MKSYDEFSYAAEQASRARLRLVKLLGMRIVTSASSKAASSKALLALFC